MMTDEQIIEIRKRHPTAIVLDGEALNFASDLLSAADTEVQRLRSAIATAYGYLWLVNNEPSTPRQYQPERAAYEARKVLRDLLTKEQRGRAINEAVRGCGCSLVREREELWHRTQFSYPANQDFERGVVVAFRPIGNTDWFVKRVQQRDFSMCNFGSTPELWSHIDSLLALQVIPPNVI